MKRRHFVISLPLFAAIIVLVVFASTLFGVFISSILTGTKESPDTSLKISNKPENSVLPSEKLPNYDQTPAKPVIPDEKKALKDKHNSGELSRHFSRGREYYNQGLYHQAAYEFQVAESYSPENPETCYFLMLCWSKIEENPNYKNSVTMSLAKRLVSIAPGSKMSEAAEQLLREAVSDKGNSTAGIVTPLQENNAKTTSVRQNGEAAPVIRIQTPYPKASLQKKPADMEVRKIDQDKDDSNNQNSNTQIQNTASLEGIVSRLDEKGQNFSPSGATLVLLRITGNEKYYATTDGAGRFRFEGIKPDGNYALICLSKYRYTRYIQDYYYNNYGPYPPCPPVYGYYNNIPSKNRCEPGIHANVILKENNNGKIGIGSFAVKKADIRINTSCYPYGSYYQTGGFVRKTDYYPGYPYSINNYSNSPNNYYTYYGNNNFSTQRAVEVEYNISWHVRMDLKQPVEYNMKLTQDNADRDFSGIIEPEYGINREPYREIRDVVPDLHNKK